MLWIHKGFCVVEKLHKLVLIVFTKPNLSPKYVFKSRYKLNMDEKVIQAGRFNNRSTGSERQDLLQSILRAEESDDEDENEVPDDDAINSMIGR